MNLSSSSSSLPYGLHACTTHSSWFVHKYKILRGVKIIKLLVLWSSTISSYLDPLRPKYLPQHPVLEQARPTSLPQWETSLTRIPTTCKIGNLSQLYLFTSLKYCFQKRVLVATSCKASDSRVVKEFAEIMNRADRGNKLPLHQSARHPRRL
jgi:hypothetical protein